MANQNEGHRQRLREKFLKSGLDHASVALVFVHNHPSGNPKPNQDDITITKKLKEAVEAIDVLVHDHLIIAGNYVYSFADHGLI